MASGVYSEFDAEGIPTKLANAEELSAKKRKDLVKDSIAFAGSTKRDRTVLEDAILVAFLFGLAQQGINLIQFIWFGVMHNSSSFPCCQSCPSLWDEALINPLQEMTKQHKDFEKLQKQAGDAGIVPRQL